MDSSFLCPITQVIMVDPVTDKEGNTFERAAIVEWLTKSGVSPITRSPMSPTDLVPNRALKDAIEAYLAAQPVAQPSSVATAPPHEEDAASAKEVDDTLQLSCVVDPVTSDVMVMIQPPALPAAASKSCNRLPVDVCCVIDISGSMGEEASVKDEKGKEERHGLNLLDVVKHAARAVAGMLGPDDRLAVVTFTDDAALALKLTSMSPAGKKQLDAVCDTLVPKNSTNLWAGLHMGMEMLRDRPAGAQARNAAVLLLTDGQPNVEPPRGHIPSLTRYLDQFNGSTPFTVSTFGFGYNLDSPLLADVAQLTGGMYVFIPDSGLVGTVFVNTMANVLCTAATSVKLSIECARPIVVADPCLTVTSTGSHAALGTVQFGQSRNVTFQMGSADTKDAAEPPVVRVTWVSRGVSYSKTVSARIVEGATETNLVQDHVARRAFATFLKAALTEVPASASVKASLAKTAAALKACGDRELPQALLKDLVGEVTTALTDEPAHRRWGRHFLPSLLCATLMQQCNNFKDKSVQLYGGKLFSALQDQGEAAFIKIPAPKPTIQRPTTATKNGKPAAPVNMTTYYNCHGGCILGSCTVALQGGKAVSASSVRAGDTLESGATVRLVIRIRVAHDLPMISFNDGLFITEYHPVKVGGRWQFPIDVAGTSRVTCSDVLAQDPFVYTFVVDGGHCVNVNGVEVISLAHGIEDEVAGHEYLGTQAVLNDLALLEGFELGHVTVGSFVRSPATMRIAGVRGVPQPDCHSAATVLVQ